MTTHDLARKLLAMPDVALTRGPVYLTPDDDRPYVVVEDDVPFPDPVEAFDRLREAVGGAYDGVDVLEFMREARGDDDA